MFLYLLVSGITTGCIYSLIALSIVVLFRSTSVVNFSQGEQVMTGGYVTYIAIVLLGHSYGLTTAVVVLVTAMLGILTFLVGFRPLYRQGLMAVFLGTLGLAFILRGGARYFFGGQGDFLTVPSPLPSEPLEGFGFAILPQQLLVVGSALAIMLAFTLFFRKTTLGRWIQATSENERAAKLVGIPVSFVHMMAFTISAAISGIAALLTTSLTFLYPDMGFFLFVKGFAAAALGGLNSLPGAVLGGVIIGVIEQMGAAYVFTGLQDVSAFVLLMIALVFLPNGLLGRKKLRAV